MAKYRKVENCGPVPYPDRSGKFLNAGEEAEGDDWEPLVALGFVVKVTEDVKTSAVAAVTPKAATKVDEPKADIVPEEASVADAAQVDEEAKPGNKAKGHKK